MTVVTGAATALVSIFEWTDIGKEESDTVRWRRRGKVKRVKSRQGEWVCTFTDGPFTETKEFAGRRTALPTLSSDRLSLGLQGVQSGDVGSSRE